MTDKCKAKRICALNSAASIEIETFSDETALRYVGKKPYKLFYGKNTYFKKDDVIDIKGGFLKVFRGVDLIIESQRGDFMKYCQNSPDFHWMQFVCKDKISGNTIIICAYQRFYRATNTYGIRVEAFNNLNNQHFPTNEGMIDDDCCGGRILTFETRMLKALSGAEPVQDDDGEGDEDP
jgi:tRNA U34 2-thiouridine synthase MnmA/TrmU